MSLRSLAAAAVVTFASFMVPSAASADDVAPLDGARSLAAAGHITEALALLDKAIAAGGRSAPVYEKRCELRTRAGQYDGALEDCTMALKLDPTLVAALEARGDIYWNRGDAKGSLPDYDAYLVARPDDGEGFWRRCDARRVAGDISGATSDCERAIALEPDIAEIHTSRGRLLLLAKKYDLAWSDFDYGVKGTGDIVPLYWRGYTSLQMKHYDKAIADFTSGIQNGDRSADVYANRARAYLGLGDKTAGLADWERAVAITLAEGDCAGAMRMSMMEALLFDVRTIHVSTCSK